ncbi:uncharacterized protein LOC127879693 [Dreissena polymorpha]|uniref:uncharacterized protein LOC127879693 n=1 Tax=Dreissena polymorpha TaxID=45954 RepID=UPI002264EEB9|nr:uncharacterized protein LOC127879693 [Dreissena polymorpha]
MHDTMPDKDYLKALCASHGIKSDQLKYECEKLCNIIHNFEHVVDVYPAYKENDVTSVFFIVTVSRQSDNLPIHLDDLRIDWPEHPHLLGKLVEAIQKEGSEREEGIDLALIQINERHPVDGKFPETEIDIDFESGKTLKPSIRNDRCYKFGKASGFTNGTLIITEQLSVIKDVLDFQGYHCVLWNQIKVQPSGQLFATNGDSGAPVFVKDGDGQLACVGIIVGGTTDGMVYVTPVTRILQEFGISQLKTFIPNIADLAKDIHSIKRTLEQLSYTVQAHMSNT